MERQFVIQMDNRPHELAHLARAMAVRGIDIRHIWWAGAGPVACAFVTCDDEDAAREVLQGLGHEFLEGETIVIEVPDRPGGLAEVAERLAAASVEILGTMIVGRREGVVDMAFAVPDAELAQAAYDASREEQAVLAHAGPPGDGATG
jgi:hypothetical protein